MNGRRPAIERTTETQNFHHVDVHITTYGAPDAEPVLLLTGNTFIEPPTAELIEHLAENGHRVVVPDHPGMGASGGHESIRTVSEVALVYRELVADLFVGPVTVIGQSLGAWMAMELALIDPEGVGRLVLLSPVGIKLGNHDVRDFRDIYGAPLDGTNTALYGARATELQGWISELTDEEIAQYARARESYAKYVWKPYLHSPVLTRWAPKIAAPIDLITSLDDAFVRNGYYDELANHLGVRRHVSVTHLPHFLQCGDPAHVAEIVLGVLKELTDSESAA